MDESANDDVTNIWRATGSLPSFSRGFDMFMSPIDADDSESGESDGFFVPSYLAGSTYVQKLEEAHRFKVQAQRESKRSATNGASQNTQGFAQQTIPTGSHRGMSHNVIERPPPFDDEDVMAPLPSRWNKDDMWGGIEVQSDALTVKYTGPRNPHERDHEASAVRADHYMPAQCGIYYYEVQILYGKRDEYVILFLEAPQEPHWL